MREKTVESPLPSQGALQKQAPQKPKVVSQKTPLETLEKMAPQSLKKNQTKPKKKQVIKQFDEEHMS